MRRHFRRRRPFRGADVEMPDRLSLAEAKWISGKSERDLRLLISDRRLDRAPSVDIVNAQEAAYLLAVSRWTVTALIRAEKLYAERCACDDECIRWEIPIEGVERLAASRKTRGPVKGTRGGSAVWS